VAAELRRDHRPQPGDVVGLGAADFHRQVGQPNLVGGGVQDSRVQVRRHVPGRAVVGVPGLGEKADRRGVAHIDAREGVVGRVPGHTDDRAAEVAQRVLGLAQQPQTQALAAVRRVDRDQIHVAHVVIRVVHGGESHARDSPAVRFDPSCGTPNAVEPGPEHLDDVHGLGGVLRQQGAAQQIGYARQVVMGERFHTQNPTAPSGSAELLGSAVLLGSPCGRCRASVLLADTADAQRSASKPADLGRLRSAAGCVGPDRRGMDFWA
jgi:hypothetical protein